MKKCTRRIIDGTLKAEVGLKALRDETAVADLATTHSDVHLNQVHAGIP